MSNFWEYNWLTCPDRPHRPPEGPNEDASVCYKCGSLSWGLRPKGETYGYHADDCSLPERHESLCVGGGVGGGRARGTQTTNGET